MLYSYITQGNPYDSSIHNIFIKRASNLKEVDCVASPGVKLNTVDNLYIYGSPCATNFILVLLSNRRFPLKSHRTDLRRISRKAIPKSVIAPATWNVSRTSDGKRKGRRAGADRYYYYFADIRGNTRDVPPDWSNRVSSKTPRRRDSKPGHRAFMWF